MLEQNQIKQAGETMDNSVSNIQLTPEAKRIIDGKIAYQTSGLVTEDHGLRSCTEV